MISEEQQTIASLATSCYLDTIIVIVVATGYGTFVLGTLIATRSLLTKTWTGSRITLAICLIMTFISLTWYLSYNEALTLIATRLTFVDIKPEEQVLLSDFIVVWRAWTLFQHAKLLKIVLAFLMIVNIGVNFADCIWSDIIIAAGESGKTAVLDGLSGLLSLVVNLFATVLITWKALQVTLFESSSYNGTSSSLRKNLGREYSTSID
ncbi:hypothetical protein GYMLUDRAFT_246586 [Collybiopsis luxurians FD-317 M1]|uniref:Uncharacterized protein n=1 Tax=Collybiopsis luxurians FD-317 M1 TaxID=944289 RepID=A0A0D0B3T8_9AGAR|nr:hypothetical protein GYMLUDRAFT_246586 [Collybiopsis luxurians FD-317 M1]